MPDLGYTSSSVFVSAHTKPLRGGPRPGPPRDIKRPPLNYNVNVSMDHLWARGGFERWFVRACTLMGILWHSSARCIAEQCIAMLVVVVAAQGTPRAQHPPGAPHAIPFLPQLPPYIPPLLDNTQPQELNTQVLTRERERQRVSERE